MLEMIDIPEGPFLMGSDPERDFESQDIEQPQHQVWLSPYKIQKTSVTIKEWMLFINETNYKWENFDKLNAVSTSANSPATFVSWLDAIQFTIWLSAKTQKQYSLPTEAQWEKACRGCQGQIYPWGNEELLIWENEIELYDINVNQSVGSRSQWKSPYGCLDMWQNTADWCSDWFRDDYDENHMEKMFINPSGPLNGKYKVFKGGNPLTSGWPRCAYRGYWDPEYQHHALGFRVVLNIG
jgi:formylglycine-generating enzyme required for sulfatase activity